MSPSGSPVREYSSIARCSCSLVTRPLRVSIWAICIRARRASGVSTSASTGG